MRINIGRLALVFFTTVLVFQGLSPAWATAVMPPFLDDMANRSDTIVTGTVEEQYSYWENGKIFTNVLVRVDYLVKEGPNGTGGLIEVKTLGGQIDELRMEVDLSPQFYEGEDVMLFLEKLDREYAAFAFHYGVLRIVESAEDGELTVIGPLFEEPTRYESNTLRHTDAAAKAGPQRLEDFIREVQGLIQN